MRKYGERVGAKKKRQADRQRSSYSRIQPLILTIGNLLLYTIHGYIELSLSPYEKIVTSCCSLFE